MHETTLLLTHANEHNQSEVYNVQRVFHLNYFFEFIVVVHNTNYLNEKKKRFK